MIVCECVRKYVCVCACVSVCVCVWVSVCVVKKQVSACRHRELVW